ncbi:MAG: invasion associated locus B family protein [Dongiaceae bacterium]
MARVPMFVLVLGALWLASPARAEDPKSIGVFGDWEAVTVKDAKGKVCYMTSNPKKSEGAVKNRQKAYAMVIHRPAEKSYDVVTFAAGYNFKEGSKVTVTIDKLALTMYTAKDHAWAWDSASSADQATDKKLVDAMRKGTDMTVKGTSARGNETVDTYSLKGFMRAYAAIGTACGLKAPAPAAAAPSSSAPASE